MLKQIFNQTKLELFFILSIFLFRFPPIYILGIHNTLLTTEAFAIFIILFEFIITFFLMITKKERIKFDKETLIVLLFFFSQSVSILGASNISSFINMYWKIILGIIVFIIGKYSLFSHESKFYNKSMAALAWGALVATILQVVLLFYPVIYSAIGHSLIYTNIFNIIMANSNIGKLVDDTYFEVVTPVLIFYYLNSKGFTKLTIIILFFAVGFISFASNLRARFLVFIFSSLITIISLKKIFRFFQFQLRKNVIIILVIIVALSLMGNAITKSITGYTVIDRFLLQDETADYNTIAWRFEMYNQSIDMVSGNPIFGVGLGNFYDFLSSKYKTNVNFILKTNPTSQEISSLALSGGTHNIFFQTLGETGLFGLFSLFIMLGSFLKKDISLFRTNNEKKRVFICCFWTLIGIAQFFPATNPTFYTLFFLFRSLI